MLSLTKALATRRDARAQADAAAVLDAIRMVRPSRATALIIGRLAWLSPSRAHVALARLEREGRVVSRWADGPYPRRRLYAIPRKPCADGEHYLCGGVCQHCGATPPPSRQPVSFDDPWTSTPEKTP